MTDRLHLRIFLASPHDVQSERALAAKVIEELNHDPNIQGKYSLEVVAWDNPNDSVPMYATMSPQEAVNQAISKPSECDIVVVILWAWMGTPLPEAFKKKDGSSYFSGTEWEYEDAMGAYEQSGKPTVLVYRRTPAPPLDLDDPERDGKVTQYERVKGFFAKFSDRTTGAIESGYNEYHSPEEFQHNFILHLKKTFELLEKRQQLPSTGAFQPGATAESETEPEPNNANQKNRQQENAPPRSEFREGWLSFDEWTEILELYVPHLEFQTDESRQTFINRVAALEPTLGVRGIRLLGRPGIGKTRLALETIRIHHLEASALYAPTPQSIPREFFAQFIEGGGLQLTLVIDNCRYSDTKELWRQVSKCSTRIQLVTIETLLDFPPREFQLPAVVVEPLGHDHMQKIVSSVYKMNAVSDFNDDKAFFSDEYSQGNVKLLIAFVNAFHHHSEIGSIGELTEVEGLRVLLDQLVPDEHFMRRTLQGLSLTYGIGVNGAESSDAGHLAAFLGLPLHEFMLNIFELQRRGLVTDKDWYMERNQSHLAVPKLLAIRLATQMWQAMEKDIFDTFVSLEATQMNMVFRNAILKRLGELGNRKIARYAVDRLLRGFESFTDIKNNAELYALIGRAEPISVLRHLRHILNGVTHDQLLTLTSERRFLIPLLESLLRLRETFQSSARILARFASAENENYGNNAVGVWKSIFLIRFGANPADPSERHIIIKELLSEKRPELRLVAVEAIQSTLNNFEGGRVIGGPEGYITPQPWYPKTWEEFWNVRKSVLLLLDQAMNDGDESVATAARECLLQLARHQVPVLCDEILDRLEALPRTDNYRIRLWQTLQEFLKYEGERLSENQRQRTESLLPIIIGDDYHSQLLIYVAHVDVLNRLDYESHEAFEKFIGEKVTSLVQQGLANEMLLHAELEWLTSLNAAFPTRAWQFMYTLGHADADHTWFSALVKLIHNNNNQRVIEAYMRGRLAGNDLAWIKQQVLDWNKHDQSLAQVALSLTTSIEVSEAGVQLVIGLLDRGWINVSDIAWRLGWAEEIPVNAMQILLSHLLQDEKWEATHAGVNLLAARLEKHPADAVQFAHEGLALLPRSVGEWTRDWQFWSAWQHIGQSYVANYPIEVAGAVLTAFKSSTVFYDEQDEGWGILRAAIRQSPHEVWELLGLRMLLDSKHPDYVSEYNLKHLQVNRLISLEILLSWVDAHRPRGARIMAEMAFIGGTPLDELVRQLLIRYGNDDEVSQRLLYHFMDIGVYEVSQRAKLLQALRERALKWLEDEHTAVRDWAQEVVFELDEQIANDPYF